MRMCNGVAGAALLAMSGSAMAGPVIGGWSAARAGSLTLEPTGVLTQLRAAILTVAPGATFVQTPTLTTQFLSTVDLVILTSPAGGVSAITPLTADEQNALRQFVIDGHTAILFVDNDTYAGAASSPANNSLIAPFGCHVTGTGAPWAVTVTDTPAFPITSGPAGQVPTFRIGWSGWLDQLGPGVVPQVSEPESGLPFLALVRRGTLDGCSGAVVIFADTTLIFDGYAGPNETTLVANAVAYAGLPCECYTNCDNSTTPPILNINDFICFQARFAAGDTYANCDHSTTPPVLNVNDFVCFQGLFAAGCQF